MFRALFLAEVSYSKKTFPWVELVNKIGISIYLMLPPVQECFFKKKFRVLPCTVVQCSSSTFRSNEWPSLILCH